MTTTLTALPRRHTPSASRPPRDLPVLFHLQDVSRPRGYSTPAKEASPPGATPAADPGSLLAETWDQQSADRIEPISDLAASIAEAALMPAADEFAQPVVAAVERDEFAGQLPAANGEEGSTAEVQMPPAPADAVSLGERAQQRQRKRQAAAKDDWFASHGKYIAIGFVMALLATIYVARSQRKTAPPEVARPPHVHQDNAPDSPVRTASAEKPSQEGPAARTAVAITSVTPTKAAGSSQTALHPPTIPQLAAQPEANPTSEGLFPWANREERIAARTDDPARTATTDQAASNSAPRDSAPLQPQSAEQPRYPSTPYPGDYRQLSAPATPAQQPAADSQPLYPTTNSPSGYRHERSGSGFH